MILILLIIFITTPVYGNTIYYDFVNKHEIVDVSDKMTLEDIKKEFDLSDQVGIIHLNEDESYTIKDNKLKKYNFKAKKAQEKAEEEAEKSIKKEQVKQKLGLTEEEFDDLKEVVGN